MVGAVLVYNDKIIGEGYHDFFGGPHAEVNCINSVRKNDCNLISKSTLYVTLEPCCFVGKTGACTDLILKSKIQKVVIGTLDPNPKVAGKGKQILVSHDIKVEMSDLERDCKDLILPFIANQQLRPFIILKWAMSHDNLIGIHDKSVPISNSLANVYSHNLRAKVDGILVGTQTVITDKPSLTTRHIDGTNPRRIILGSKLTTPKLKDYKDGDILVQKKSDTISTKFHTHLKSDPNDLVNTMSLLFNEGINSLLVEGGQKVLKSFIKSNLWDEAIIIQSENRLNLSSIEKGIKAPLIHGSMINKYQLANNTIIKLRNTDV